MSVSLYGSGQTVLQVVNANIPTGFSTTANTPTATTATATITPQSTTSKILVLYTCIWNGSANGTGLTLAVYRGGSSVSGDIGGQYTGTGSSLTTGQALTYLDSPSTTSATTYTIYARNSTATGTVSTTNAGTITLIEISGS